MAHVIRQDGERETVLGQAWIAAANTLITCGHVVDQFVADPSEIQILFLSSGNRYDVRGVRLHPSFVRQPDQLVKFDAAVLFVDLDYPEREANPLPIQYDKTLTAQQALAAVRYPAHLGPLSGNPSPLTQVGRYLGPLRKHDDFHLLHDLSLSPGDSGAAIFDADTVIAIHCGDTATLPGLNLPTTAIRLCLWVDALRDLGIKETFFPKRQGTNPLMIWAAAVAAFALAFLTVGWLIFSADNGRWNIAEPEIQPVDVSFNKPPHEYTPQDSVSITLLPRSNCYLYLFYVDNTDHVMKLYPPYGEQSFVQAGSSRTVERFGSSSLKADSQKGKLFLVALNSPDSPLRDWDYADRNPADSPLKLTGKELEKLIQERIQKEPATLFASLEAPTSRSDTDQDQ
jgi:hypothetical protein